MTAEPALKLVETTPVEEKALSIVDQAKAVKVTDAQTYTAAGSIWKAIGDMIKEVKDTFDPICDAAHKAHKQAVEKRSKYLDPLAAAQKAVKGLMSAYDAEQDRLRREEQARLEAIARKQEEERRLQEAIEAEEAMKAQGAGKEEIAQETAAILETPVTIAPVVLQKTTPKLQGGPVFKTHWSASVTDIKALCLAIGTGKASTEFVIGLDRNKDTGIVTSPSLNRQATSQMQTMNIPGVIAISRRV